MSYFVLRKFFPLLYRLRRNDNLVIVKSVRLLCSYRDDSSFSSKFKVFKDEDSEVIYDVQEERLKKQNSIKEKKYPVPEQNFEKNEGEVLSVEDVVELVKSHNGNDIFVIKLPSELNYVDFMVIISGTSRRHLNGLAELIRKEFKRRRSSEDSVPNIEGANSDWIAIDLGNIAIHIMMESVRKVYDLESLWTVGAKYDLKLNMGNRNEEVLQLLKQHSMNLDDLQPNT